VAASTAINKGPNLDKIVSTIPCVPVPDPEISIMSASSSDPVLFEALIVPHRSLSPRGVRVVMLSLLGLTALIGLRFWLIGAWPVLLISGPEMVLAAFLLRLNTRRARASELVLLQDDVLLITRTDMHGKRQQVRLPTAWLNVSLLEAPNRIPRLLLRNRDTNEEIGRVLGEDAKRDLADALGRALHDVRNPRFDNAQLRD
jgi:uncharacterized membrane protein